MGDVTFVVVGGKGVTIEVNGATNALEALKAAGVALDGKDVRVNGEKVTASTTIEAGDKGVIAPQPKGA